MEPDNSNPAQPPLNTNNEPQPLPVQNTEVTQPHDVVKDTFNEPVVQDATAVTTAPSSVVPAPQSTSPEPSIAAASTQVVPQNIEPQPTAPVQQEPAIPPVSAVDNTAIPAAPVEQMAVSNQTAPELNQVTPVKSAEEQIKAMGTLPSDSSELDSYLGIGAAKNQDINSNQNIESKKEHQFTPNDLPPLPKETTNQVPVHKSSRRGLGGLITNIFLLLIIVIFAIGLFTGGYLYGDKTFDTIDSDGTYRMYINDTLNRDIFPLDSIDTTIASEDIPDGECSESERYTDSKYGDFAFTYNSCEWNFSRTESDNATTVLLSTGASTLTFSITEESNADLNPSCFAGSFVVLSEDVTRFWDDSNQPSNSTSIFNYSAGIFDDTDSRFNTYATEGDVLCTDPTDGFITSAEADLTSGLIVSTLDSDVVTDIQSADSIVRTISY